MQAFRRIASRRPESPVGASTSGCSEARWGSCRRPPTRRGAGAANATRGPRRPVCDARAGVSGMPRVRCIGLQDARCQGRQPPARGYHRICRYSRPDNWSARHAMPRPGAPGRSAWRRAERRSTIDPPGDPHRTASGTSLYRGVAAQVASSVVTDYPRPPDDTLHLYKVLLCLSHCSIYSDRVAPPSISMIEAWMKSTLTDAG
jgi:hypothetical protein